MREAVRASRPDAIIHESTALAGGFDVRNLDRSFTSWPYAREGGPIESEDDPLDTRPPRQSHAPHVRDPASPAFARMIPMSAPSFMHLVGIVEVIAGLLVLSKLTRVGAYVVMAWLVCIAINLVSMGLYDIAVRDLAMAVGAFALARLEEVRAGAPVRVRRQVPATAGT